MKRISLSLFALLLTAVTVHAQPVVNSNGDTIITCESLNNIRHTCRTNTLGTITLSRRLSSNACVRGQSWGTSRNGRAVWVDKGCRAEFLVGNGMNPPQYSSTGRSVICESAGGRQRCAADTSYGVQLSRQISSHSCNRGSDWGYDQNGVWVTNGCRAEFLIGTSSARYPAMSSSSGPTLVCESGSNQTTRCAANTDFGISLTRQISKASCVRGRTWGYDRSGVWVSNGCRAEFTLGQ